MPFAPINGIDLYYEEHGDGPPLVFAHGVGGNHASWYQQVPFFARSYRAITCDQRGRQHLHGLHGALSRADKRACNGRYARRHNPAR